MQPDVSTFEDDPMQFILRKYEGLNKTLTYLMTPSFQDYVTGIYIVAPKPTTFKIVLHNGQFFFLQFTGKTYEATVAGKGYYLMNIGEKERCMLAIARLLRYGNPLKTKGPEGAEQGTREGSEAESTGGEAGSEVPEATPEGGEEEALAEARILEEVLKKTILKESSEDFDTQIKKELGLKEDENIPKCKSNLQVGTNFKLSSDDLDIWKKLYTIKPLTKKGTPTAGSGNGEIATYWCFQYNENGSKDVMDGRGSDKPDLIIDGIGVEVKAYNENLITLGKFSSDTANVQLLNNVFSFKTLLQSVKAEEGIADKSNPGNFKTSDLIKACELIIDFYNNENLKDAATKYNLGIIKNLYDIIDNKIISLLEKYENDANKMAASIIRKVLRDKLHRKPMMEKSIGYVLNVSQDGSGEFTEINDQKINAIKPESLLNSGNFIVKSSEIKINFKNLFSSGGK